MRRLTDDPAQDWDPTFSREGKLLWSSNRSGVFEIWTASADGTGAKQVTHDGVDAENPGTTADGSWVVYASARPHNRGIMKMRPDGSEPTLLVGGNAILPEVSPDGLYVAYVGDLGGRRAALRVVRLADGKALPFEVELSPWIAAGSLDLGRCRWLPDGRGLVFIGQDANGAYGVYLQEFSGSVELGPSTAPRRLVAFEPDLAAESLAVSPDGSRLTVAYWDQLSNLMLADQVPGIATR